jgi:hypothetical protein
MGMKRPVKTMVAAIALTMTLALPAGAGAKTGAGVVFHEQFGEECHIE